MSEKKKSKMSLLVIIAALASSLVSYCEGRNSVSFDFGWRHRTGLHDWAKPNDPAPIDTNPGEIPAESRITYDDSNWYVIVSHSLAHSLIYSRIHLFIHSFTSFDDSLARSLMFTNLFTHSPTHSLTHSLIYTFNPSPPTSPPSSFTYTTTTTGWTFSFHTMR